MESSLLMKDFKSFVIWDWQNLNFDIL